MCVLLDVYQRADKRRRQTGSVPITEPLPSSSSGSASKPVPTPDLAPDRAVGTPRPAIGALAAVGNRCERIDGTVSIWCSRVPSLGDPARAAFVSRSAQATHYAASTMKLALMLAAYRAHDAGTLDLDEPIAVHDTFVSAVPGADPFSCTPGYDSDPQVWAKLGTDVPVRWLARRSIVKSSNLATDLLLERIGFAAVEDVYALVGAQTCTLTRMIQDSAALDAGLTNTVTAAGLARVLGAIAAGSAASPAACAEMLDVLRAQEWRDDIIRGLPAGTRVAHKNGWVEGVRHSIALIEPDDAVPYLLATCTTSAALSAAASLDLLTDIAAASWADRFALEASG
jgi:beta-lactamase class A